MSTVSDYINALNNYVITITGKEHNMDQKDIADKMHDLYAANLNSISMILMNT